MRRPDGTYLPVPIAERIMLNSTPEPNSGCWLWDKSVNKRTGYGQIGIGSHSMALAHRASYEAFKGPLSRADHVLHKCDVRSCVNPDHLFIGTHDDNMQDRQAKGRQAKGERVACAKLKEADVAEIIKSPLGSRRLARLYGVNKSTILDVRRGHTWKHVGGVLGC